MDLVSRNTEAELDPNLNKNLGVSAAPQAGGSLYASTAVQRSRLSDRELIALVQQSDEPAFVQLMQRHKEAIINFVYRFVGNWDDAIDLAQETFVRLHRYAHTYNGEVAFSTWLYTIASNLAKTELSRYWRKNSQSFSSLKKTDDDDQADWDIACQDYSPDKRIDSTMIAQNIQRALMAISPAYREVVILRDMQNLSYEEIAEITNLEAGTVKSRINRGRAQLQEKLQPLYSELFG